MSSCQNKKPADLIIYDARLFTVDENFSVAEAMAVKDGKILATGTSERILSEYQSGEMLDLDNKFVYPGFIDAHCHFLSYGLSLRNANLVGTSSFEEIVDILKVHQAACNGEWVLGRGWDQNDWEVKEFPDRELLDKAFPDTPVLLRRIDGHAAIANKTAIDLAGINEKTKVQGGTLVKKNGSLTGVLIDNAIGLVGRLVPEPSLTEKLSAIRQAQKNCFSVGLTSVHEAGLDHGSIQLIDSLQKSGDLKMRIYAMLSPGKENYEHFMFKGIYKTDRLNVRSIKLFADGALGSRGAMMIEPYSDDPGNRGLAVASREYLEEQCKLAHQYNYQVNTHCIGDGANRLMLEIYSDLLEGKNDRRWRIEHAQVVQADDFHLFGDYSIIPSIQSTHASSDMDWAGDRLGDERMKGAYACRQLLQQNGWIPNGSDFPVEDIQPVYGFYSLVARKDTEALDREDALRAMTIWAASAAFEENEKGSLEPGKMADFVISPDDLMNISEQDIPGFRVSATYSEGKQVYPH